MTASQHRSPPGRQASALEHIQPWQAREDATEPDDRKTDRPGAAPAARVAPDPIAPQWPMLRGPHGVAYRLSHAWHAVMALLLGATLWGLLWFPYRWLATQGVSGSAGTAITYAVALGYALLMGLRSRGRDAAGRPDPGADANGLMVATSGPPAHPARSASPRWMGFASLVPLALAAGLTNLGFVWSTVHGEVMRVLLLFYLMPLWTLLLAWPLLGERPGLRGVLCVGMALLGAMLMLTGGALGWPLPSSMAEWVGLGAGLSFALTNVLIRRAHHLGVWTKAAAVFLGGAVVGTLMMPLEAATAVDLPGTAGWLGLGVVLMFTSVALIAANLCVQYGLRHLPANRCAVIMLFELIIAALSSWALAGEVMGLAAVLGGVLIAGAGLAAGWAPDEPRASTN